MANKTFNQYCPIAHSLDLVGDRWMLLIIRNLSVGSKRFSDLLKGLPGISPNILTDRLKLLQEEGVAETRYLPPPAASTVYELTSRGRSLMPILIALSQWGSESLGAPQPDQFIVTEGVQFMIFGAFDRQHHPAVNLACNVHVQDARYDHTFGVLLTPQGAQIGEAALQPFEVELQLGLESLSNIASRRTRLPELVQNGLVHFEGEQTAAQTLIQWLDS